MARSVKIQSNGIKNSLKKLGFSENKLGESIAEYIWNGFDAGATSVSLNYDLSESGRPKRIEIVDNGGGIEYGQLLLKFDVLFETEKLINNSIDRNSSLTHGRNGIGRLAFFTFAGFAKWDTVYEKDSLRYQYEIDIAAEGLDKYSVDVEPILVEKETGTRVTFDGFNRGLNDASYFESLEEYLKSEFCWYLELNEARGLKLIINGTIIDYSNLIADEEPWSIITHPASQTSFKIRYIRWVKKLNEEYSKYYYLDSNGKELFKENTKLNNQSDSFFHSVFISSPYFDDFNFKSLELEEKQRSLGKSKSDEPYKFLQKYLVELLRKKRKPFLEKSSLDFVRDLEKRNIVKSTGNTVLDVTKKQEFVSLIRSVYEIRPAILHSLSDDQLKIILGLLDLLLDSNERDRILSIFEEYVDLDPEQREKLSKQLQVTTLSRIINTVELIKDRYKTIDVLRKIVFEHELDANEIKHLQTVVQNNYWIFGENYSLVAAAEDNFEKALRNYHYLLEEKEEIVKLTQPGKLKQMDIFICRQQKHDNTIHNIIVELKHPSIRIGEKQVSQLKEYMRTVVAVDQFNADSYSWDFILIGNRYDDSRFVENELKGYEKKGVNGLIQDLGTIKVYVRKWSDIFNECDLRHEFINSKLELDKNKLTPEELLTADNAMLQIEKSSARSDDTRLSSKTSV